MNTKSFHLDQDIRIDNIRCAGFIFKDNKVLIIHRKYHGKEYYVIPGGHMQKGETQLQTLNREIMEETSLKVKNIQSAYEFKDEKNGFQDFYFTCDWESGEAKLGGEEEMKNSEENFFELMWIELSEIKNYFILPELAKIWLQENIIDKV